MKRADKKPFSALIFESDTNDAVYCWNGKRVICIRPTVNRPLGQDVTKGFPETDFKKLYQNCGDRQYSMQFFVGKAKYNILNII